MRPARFFASFAIVLIAYVALYGADLPQLRPDKAAAEVARFLEDRPLELSLSEQSASKRFYFVCEAQVMNKGSVQKALDVVVAREGDKAAALVRYADGQPHFYVTDKLMIIVNPATNRLSVYQGGRPHFVLRAADGLSFFVACRGEQIDREFIADFPSILDGIKQSKFAFFDHGTGSLRYSTERRAVRLDFNGKAESSFVVDRATLQGRAGDIVVWPILVGEKAKHPLNLFDMTADALKQNGIPFDEIDEAAADQLVPMPSSDSVQDAELRTVLDRWESLFRRKND